jgi:hypothetical protein
MAQTSGGGPLEVTVCEGAKFGIGPKSGRFGKGGARERSATKLSKPPNALPTTHTQARTRFAAKLPPNASPPHTHTHTHAQARKRLATTLSKQATQRTHPQHHAPTRTLAIFCRSWL